MMLANELGPRDISTLVVDRESGVATAPQANATQASTMKRYRRLGFAEAVRALGMPPDHPTDVAYFTSFAGFELGPAEMPPSGEAAARIRELDHIWNGAELPHRVPQSLVEEVLHREASRHPNVEIRFDTAATEFTEDEAGVAVHLADPQGGNERSVRARYLFSADGSQSAVRRQLGIRYSGGDEAERDFMGGEMLSIYLDVPAFCDVMRGKRAWMYWTFSRRRRALLATIDGKGRLVLQTQLRPGEDAGMSHADAGQLFLQAVGAEIPFRITGIATWLAGRALVADSFGRGRVLLGGDAVRILTPTAGMDYNTAIKDAVNAGWKLAAIVKGQAPEALLESYEAERRPIALHNTAFASGFADSIELYVPSPAIEDEGVAGEAARKRAGAYFAGHGRWEFTIPGFSFGARYDASPVIVAEAPRPPPDAPSVFAPSVKPGGRAPHVWLMDGASLFDRLGFEWTLLRLREDDDTEALFAEAARSRNLDLTLLDLSGEPMAVDLYEHPFALIRPDQIVVWRGDGADVEAVAAILDKVTGAA